MIGACPLPGDPPLGFRVSLDRRFDVFFKHHRTFVNGYTPRTPVTADARDPVADIRGSWRTVSIVAV